ncbi:MAG: hypothetical protein H6945_10520 [Zoogloeaceae bacterium]|nr:hypothetical protein [Rhodocyclaceae bacterium]MCP5236157.1 hypothetical protein [Zoogloeaceae bacterium]
MRALAVAIVCLFLAAHAAAEPVTISPSDTTQSFIVAHKGQRVMMRLRSGQEMSGTIRDASERLLVLGEVAGREFFDAVIPIDAIEAVLVRVRDR